MTFLAMDTSGAMCVLALAESDGTVSAVSVFAGRRSLSRRLMGEVDGLLTRSGLTLHDLSAFAVGVGPGSFTGVRVGVTTAKIWAQVTGKPLIGVGTLDAYAAEGHGDLTLAIVLPSRRGEVYAALYHNGARQGEPFASGMDALEARLKAYPVEGGCVIVGGEPEQLSGWTGPKLSSPWTPPAGLAALAAEKLRHGAFDDPLGLVPAYVVSPSISTPKNDPKNDPKSAPKGTP